MLCYDRVGKGGSTVLLGDAVEIDELTQRRTQRLCETGFSHLQNEDWQSALDVAAELEKIGFSASFDIAAQAHAGQGDLEAAIRVLERGVEAMPSAWPNWQLLGNYHSDLGHFDEAEAAYRSALACDDAWAASLKLNQAILASRRGDHGRALALIEGVADPALAAELDDARVHALVRVGRAAEAVTVAERVLGDPDLPRAEPELAARLLANLGRARLALGAVPAEARELALEALELSRNDQNALELVRELSGKPSPVAKYMRLVLHVRSPGDPDALGYYASYDVVADDAHQALSLVRALEPNELALVEVSEASELEACPGELTGVHVRSGRIYYQSDD